MNFIRTNNFIFKIQLFTYFRILKYLSSIHSIFMALYDAKVASSRCIVGKINFQQGQDLVYIIFFISVHKTMILNIHMFVILYESLLSYMNNVFFWLSLFMIVMRILSHTYTHNILISVSSSLYVRGRAFT